MEKGEGDPAARRRDSEGGWQQEPLRTIGAALLAAGGLITFVAAVGGAIVWVRFYAARLPADQALAAMPRGELIAGGAIMLAAFVLLGALAVIAVYVFQDQVLNDDQPSRGVVRGLLALVTAESIVVIGLAVGIDRLSRLVAAESILLFALLILLVIRWRESQVGHAVEPDIDDPPLSRVFGELIARMADKLSGGVGDRPGSNWPILVLFVLILVAVVVTAALELASATPGAEHISRITLRAAQATTLTFILVCAALFVGVRWIRTGLRDPMKQSDQRISHSRFAPRVIREGLVRRYGGRRGWRSRGRFWARTPVETPVKPPPGRRNEDGENAATEILKRAARVVIFGLALAGAASAALVMREVWVAVTLAAAILLGTASWRIARRSNYAFLPCGVAVFASVPLLGAVAGIARNLEDPQVQPLALIRAGDGEAEALQGIYVTETDSRVYFGTVATDRCSGEVEPGSGRLLWVPREDVVAMSVGPPQSVADAGVRAQEMYYALAPQAANPYAGSRAAGSPVVLPPGKSAPAAPKRSKERRLENVGSALRREFDLASAPHPARARIGEKVTVRGSGFDQVAKAERTVQVGDVEADVKVWRADRVVFKVPKKAASGQVTIACKSPATEPHLRVLSKPHARIRVQPPLPREQLLLDGRLSADAAGGALVAFSWSREGSREDNGSKLVRSVHESLGLQRFSLEVADDDGESDLAHVDVIRLLLSDLDEIAIDPSASDSLTRLRSLLRRDRRRIAVLHGYSGRRLGADTQASRMADELVALITAGRPGPVAEHISKRMSIRAFGEGCASLPRGAAHVDVFLVDPGSEVAYPGDCDPDLDYKARID